jgi:hypothetical protein
MVTQHVRAGDLASARAVAHRIRELAPEGLPSSLADAQIADKAGDLGEAVRLYERACSHGQEFACTRAQQLREQRARPR